MRQNCEVSNTLRNMKNERVTSEGFLKTKRKIKSMKQKRLFYRRKSIPGGCGIVEIERRKRFLIYKLKIEIGAKYK